MKRQHASGHGQGGFTLVEVVVALTLLSLIVLGLLGALRSIGQTGERLEAQALVNDDLRLVSALLQSSLASASSSQRVALDAESQTVWLQGGPQSIEWLGVLPARHGVGGVMHLRLQLEATGVDHHRLVLYMAAYRGPEKVPDWEAFEPRVLLDGVTSMRVHYLGVREAQWTQEWQNETVLPEVLHLALSLRGRTWPPLVVRLLNSTDQPRPAAVVTERVLIELPDA